MNNKVYVITCGEYSDYCILHIFATLEAAEKYYATHWKKSSEPLNIEIWDLEDGNDIECDTIYKALEVYVYNGTVRSASWKMLYDTKPFKFEFRKGIRTYYNDKYIIPVNKTVENAEQAQKIVSDTVAKMKAEEAGL